MAKNSHTAEAGHISFGQYLKDVVFGANDGIITTFAVVAGVAGAELSTAIVLIIGIANLIADGFSMATGNYLGTKSENEFYQKEEAKEKAEIKNVPEEERGEIREVLIRKGYSGEDLEKLVMLISSNEKFWVDFMMHEELGLFAPSIGSPTKHALATFISFVLAGSIPLIPYLIPNQVNSFLIAAIFSGTALFIVGALRKYFSTRSWFVSGLEVLLVGGFAAAVAYSVGYILKSII